MEIKLTLEEKEKFFFSALCNLMNGWFEGYGLRWELDFSDTRNPGDTIEDLILRGLKEGKKLGIKDIEGEGEWSREVGLEEIYSRFEKVSPNVLMNFHNEEDDISDADHLMQIILFEEEVFA